MILLNTQLEGLEVMSLQTGGTLGQITEPIIDPRKLQIIAYYVVGPRIQSTSIVHTADIREVGGLGFIVDGNDKIMELDEDLVRLKEVIDFNFKLIGKAVIDDGKQRLGKVSGYTVEDGDFFIQKLHVHQSVLKNLASSGLVIHRSQIVEITDHAIIVKSASVPKTTGLTQAINPFRKQSHLQSGSSK